MEAHASISKDSWRGTCGRLHAPALQETSGTAACRQLEDSSQYRAMAVRIVLRLDNHCLQSIAAQTVRPPAGSGSFADKGQVQWCLPLAG